MSELGNFGLTAPPPPVPRAAATVILWRGGPQGLEVYLVRRGATQRYAAGFHAFPGGRRDEADQAVPVRSPGEVPPADLACAARELFEEVGVLAAAGGPLPGAEALAEARRELLGERLGFGEFLSRHRLEVDGARFTDAGRWVTPAFYPARFDAVFLLCRAAAGDHPEVWPGELESGEFAPAPRALEDWRRGDKLFLPPNLWPLRVLARGPAADGAPDAEAMRRPPPEALRMEFQGGLLQSPLRTPTLPPATHTNAWLVDLGDATAVVDPGSPWIEEQAKLDERLATLAAEGRPAREVWLTHGHADHVGGVAHLAARGLAGRGLTVRAHPAIAPRLPGIPFEPLAEGDLLGGRWRVHETPGHARDHVVFLDEATGALLCGDMVSTLSTVVIDPPEGDMAEYERQLARLAALPVRALYPAHGQPAAHGRMALEGYLAHRAERERKVLGALAVPGTLAEVTARAYDDVPPRVWPVAERTCLATLEKLARLGAAEPAGGRWRAVR
jgi:glyoxylase-like metal-dependent hydrolase (beta-lactamase superfamily II)/8-oxo-dGTP pyrophosphatase MutT (NUDIX family)